MAPYQYTQLQDTDYIRLLNVQSGDDDSPIICSLTQAALEEKPHYIALSYTWEVDDSDSCAIVQQGTITCDRAELSVTSNLYAALKSLRCRGGEDCNRLPFWIDAICINQKDDAEKNQQIKIMHTIYSQADHVIAWLGEEQATDYGAKPALEQLSRYIASRNGDLNASEIMQHYNDPGETAMPKYNSFEWTAINSILGKRWFSRVWIIQEIVMAPHLSFRYGNMELDLLVIEIVLDFLGSSPLSNLASLQKSKKALTMINTARMAKSALAPSRPRPWTLMEVLWVTRNYGASVAKDRFFAFLGLVKDISSSFLIPDYNLSDAEIYIQLAAHSIVEQGSFKLGRKQAWKDEWPPKGTATPGYLEISLLVNEFINEAKDIATEAFFTTRSTSSQAPPEYAQSFKAYCEVLGDLLSGSSVHQATRSLYLKAMDFDQAFSSYSNGRKFGITQGLRMGMFPNTVQQDDIIFAPKGANVPLVLREAKDRRYKLVGECYLHGVMYGEVAEEPGWEKNIEEVTLC
ncbi:Heterokaryon incompatibility protein 6,OR allele [Lachnellula subtilissima]|uniref:Heterokaryon incompatibility protein 6,OR allele n=1 Tax=Lachnellula subtilissima TaxID=602034 RepID=A0A8H8RCJ6_9HELO|nr:Heterokaryon incompatibility protein 6,OR allele [Lachnellula subtilissima]